MEEITRMRAGIVCLLWLVPFTVGGFFFLGRVVVIRSGFRWECYRLCVRVFVFELGAVRELRAGVSCVDTT